MVPARTIGLGVTLLLLSTLLVWADAVDLGFVETLRAEAAGWRDGLGFLARRCADFLHDRQAALEDGQAAVADELSAGLIARLEAENTELRALLGLKLRSPWRLVSAEYLPGPPARLEAGSADGLTPGMAVVDGRGLIGVLGSCGSHTSEVLGFDRLGPRGVHLTGCGQNGVLELMDGELVVVYLAAAPRPREGELVVTSGPGRLPAGVPVGRVLEVRHRPGELELSCSLGPPRPDDETRVAHVVARAPEAVP